MFSLFNAIQIISVRVLSGSDQVLFTWTDLLIAYLQKYSKYYYKYLCIYRYCSISVELRRWSGDGAYPPDWTNTGFSFILLTVNLFRHSTLIEQGL